MRTHPILIWAAGALLAPGLAGCCDCECPRAQAPTAVALEPEPCPLASSESDELEEPDDEPVEVAADSPPEEDGSARNWGPPDQATVPVLAPVTLSSMSGFGNLLRDPRRSRSRPRATGLLQSECQGLERLFRATSAGSPDRPQLIRRLAEAYVELTASASGDTRMEPWARQHAIRYYARHKADYPNDAKADEVLYYLALEHERAGDANEARRTYYELIQRAPKSPFVPLAYLAFGETFFAEAQSDPSKWALVEAAYGKVVKYPAPANRAQCYAYHQLGFAARAVGDRAKAKSFYNKARICAQQYPGLPESAEVGGGAARALRRL